MITLSVDELIRITGYEQPNRQVKELLDRGFWRARIGRMGEAILERVHYEAVCAGAVQPQDCAVELQPQAPLPPRRRRSA